MGKVMTAEEAVSLVKNGDCICVNSFVGLSYPGEIYMALNNRYVRNGEPKDITFISSAGFGDWTEDSPSEEYIKNGAVRRIISGHFGAMLSTKKLVLQDKFEAYNLPLGAISHAIRAQAGGLPGVFSKVGIGIYVDPRIEGSGINAISTDGSLVQIRELDGEEYLYYRLPKITVAFIKATASDAMGNISFEDEYVTGDALSIAQAAKANGGCVIVQTDRISDELIRPRNRIIPGCLVDAVVVKDAEKEDEAFDTLSGTKLVELSDTPKWLARLNEMTSKKAGANQIGDIIGRRAAKELKKGDIVNIGIGLPENVSRFSVDTGLFDDITLTVESGATCGLPASGTVFGSMIGAKCICDMSMQFDFYDGGGLDICFMGGLEVDAQGNVNAHRASEAFSGIGGFANITCNTPVVIFCLTFNTKGLKVHEEGERIVIDQEGSIPKIVDHVSSISFSGRQAVLKGQRVLYVTERCVFELKRGGLTLIEVYPGIDMKEDITDRLGFEVNVSEKLKQI